MTELYSYIYTHMTFYIIRFRYVISPPREYTTTFRNCFKQQWTAIYSSKYTEFTGLFNMIQCRLNVSMT